MTNSKKIYSVGEVSFDAEVGVLEKNDGTKTNLRPQTAQVLSILADNSGQVVSKESLMNQVWSDTHVTDDSLVQCISEIRKSLGDTGSTFLKTVPKQGYKLEASEREPVVVAPPVRQKWIGILIAALLVLTAVLYLNGPFQQIQDVDGRTEVSLAVMPFQNDSEDPAQRYFSSGVAEDLIVRLSKISDLRVLSRGTSFSMAGQGLDTIGVASKLNANFLLEGSVRRQNDELRITATLVNGSTGEAVWGQRYEGTSADVFLFQDQVLDELVTALSLRLSPTERERLGVHGTTSIEAHDAYLRGRELENKFTKSTNLEAEEAFVQAIQIDGKFALAYAHLSQVYSFRLENGWTNATDQYVDAAFSYARRAIEIDPELPFAHFALGRLFTRSFAPDAAKAIAAYKKALELDPNYVDVYVFLANIHIFSGEAEKALPLIDQGFERNPIPPFWYYQAQGMAAYFLGDFIKAESALVRARDQNPTAPYPYRFLVATYGQLNNIDEAEWMAMEYESLGRLGTVSAIMSSASVQNPAYRLHFEEGLRKAGLPGS